jgi:hypothetical protein
MHYYMHIEHDQIYSWVPISANYTRLVPKKVQSQSNELKSTLGDQRQNSIIKNYNFVFIFFVMPF